MSLWRTLVGKLWITIICLVACVLLSLGLFLLPFIDTNFTNPGAIKRLFVIASMIGFSLTTFFALFLFTKITQPMQQLIKATDSIRKGKYHTRLSLRTTDEIGELASAFNHMAEELENTIRSLNHEKEHLASVLRSMNDAVITLDGEGSVILTNPPGDQIMKSWGDLPEEEEEGLVGKGQHDRSGTLAPQPLLPLFRSVLNQEGDQSSNVHVKQGVWSVHMAPLTSESEIRGAVAVLRDVTEEVRLEKMRRDFVANVSHEIRTPLSMMQGYSEALLDGIATSPTESMELVQVIHDESLRMGRLVRDLLDLARMEAGHTDTTMRHVDFRALVERVYRKFAVRAKDNAIALNLEFRNDELYLKEANEDRLEQVLTNLLDNAFRHTPEGANITIIAGTVKRTSGLVLEVSVRDEGVGIPSEDLPYIFERFYKADKARVRGEAGGTGLGLSIVKNIIEAHHGSIHAESEVGKGTVFNLMLPVEKVQ
ncbi:two-component system sensor histidine kinase ResE [Paenibacillus anaericanus]|uniref:ATP-binding protein n=1 Tax=Paenibacillus anaericanus TaxID=170367 RepID=UPI00277F60D1|nr:ATP-binding protein [Paenibacillus anaericanus]MDQ0088152.1 two-component system sensor histidine kinase ResE [Paenibacillus anaericanus]